MKRRILTIGGLLFSLAGGLFAQALSPTAILQYFDDPTQVTVTDASGSSIGPVTFGMAIPTGDTITTRASTAELQLQPNGSILKLAANTTFKIQTLQGLGGQQANEFALLAGQIRAVAAHSPGGDNYSFATPTAVCGVRGTDFALEVVPGRVDEVGVLLGKASFVDLKSGTAVTVDAGKYANTYAAVFEPVEMSGDRIDALFTRMNFERLNPQAVPGHAKELEASEGAQQLVATSPAPAATAKPQTSSESSASKPGAEKQAFGPLHDHLAIEVGGLSINGTTYEMGALVPKFSIGGLHVELYLPIIFQNNLFDSSDWYHPSGNDEWDFGLGSSFGSNTWARVGDATTDLLLKIRSLSAGTEESRFHLRGGNLHDVTLGGGVLMDGYTNDADYPAVRHIGMNLGLDLPKGGFQLVASDLSTIGNLIGGTSTTNPEIFGGRFFSHPIPGFGLALGLSTIVDFNPASALASEGLSTDGDPIFITFGPDFVLPFVQSAPFSIAVFADAGALVPVFRTPLSSSVGSGLYYQALWYNNGLTNYGVAGGVVGNVSSFGWRLELRYSNGVFQTGMFDGTYDRTRSLVVADLASYLANPGNSAYQTTTIGLYGQGALSLGNRMSLSIGYFWPFKTNGFAFNNDYFHLAFVLKKGIIPGFPLHGSISFDRRDFMPTIIGNSGQFLGLFDANTTLKASLIYPVAPVADIRAIVATAFLADPTTGALTVNPAIGLPTVAPVFTIETVVHP